jgi:hypothetical protein
MQIKPQKTFVAFFFLLALIALLFTWMQQPQPIEASSQAATPNNLCFTSFLPMITGGSGVPNNNGGVPAELPHSYESCAGFPDFNGDGYADLAIGAPYENMTQGVSSYTKAGIVQVIYGTAHGLTAQAATAFVDDQVWSRLVDGLDTIAINDNDNFGSTLGIGDFNNDGYDDLAIGVPGSTVSGQESAGAVQVLYGTKDGLTATGSQTWTQDTGAIDNSADANDNYGRTLTTGDYNGDGYADLAVGVPNETVNGNANAGAVNILFGSSSGLKSAHFGGGKPDEFLTQNTVNFFASAQLDDHFGSALTTGDFNNDGLDDLAVGVSHEDNGAGFDDAGAVQIFFGSDEGIIDDSDDAIYPQQITANTPGVDNAMEAGDLFGYTLAAADFDRDGFDDLAIGTPYETHGSGGSALQYAGAVNIVFGASSGLDAAAGAPIWTQNSAGMDSEAATQEYFGWSLEAADFNNDGYADLAIGAPYDHVLGAAIGSVHIMYGSSTGPSENGDQLIYDPGNPAANDAFGFSLTAVDANGDSYMDLVVGAYRDDPVGIKGLDVGSVFVFHSNNNGVSQTDNQYWYQGHDSLAEAPEGGDLFGRALP